MGALSGFYSQQSFDYPPPPWPSDGVAPFGTHHDDNDDDGYDADDDNEDDDDDKTGVRITRIMMMMID